MQIALRSSWSASKETVALWLWLQFHRTFYRAVRNSDGGDDAEAAAAFSADLIGNGHPLDHVGVRVRAPYDRQ